jgi:hypothetical protein
LLGVLAERPALVALAGTVPLELAVLAVPGRLAPVRPDALAAAPLVVVEVPRVTPAREVAADWRRAVGRLPDRLDVLPAAPACFGVPAWPPVLL